MQEDDFITPEGNELAFDTRNNLESLHENFGMTCKLPNYVEQFIQQNVQTEVI